MFVHKRLTQQVT